MKLISILLFAAACSFGQGSQVNQVEGPSGGPATTQLLFYDGASNLKYVCMSPQVQQLSSRVAVAGASLTNIVVSSNVGTVTTAAANGLYVGAIVTVSGSATTALNGTYSITSVPSSTTYTIATSGVANATYTTGLVVVTFNPLTTAPVWAIRELTYCTSGTSPACGTTVLTSTYWAAGSKGYGLACTAGANY